MPTEQTYIIAEAGVNHNGSLDLARELIEVAAKAGADAVKFQTFKAEETVSKSASKAEYQQKTASAEETQYDMLKRLELSAQDHQQLIQRCQKYNIQFLSTPFGLGSVDLLAELGLNTWKIPSGDITNLPYLRKIGKRNEHIILSTGMADLGEIEDALEVLENAGTHREKVTILHCNTEYPSPMQDVNLRAMQTIAHAFPGIKVGYSDHTEGIEIPIAAVTKGATVIEKHFTTDHRLDGPDHEASLEPAQLTSMVKAIRKVETAMGDGQKKASVSEMKNKNVVRKSIVADSNIRSGDMLSEQNLAVKRPGGGLSPMLWDSVIGRYSDRGYSKDDFIEL